MKNLKYIKLFEAFESVQLSKTLGFIKDKENFINLLKTLANRIDFPYSKYSDDYFQYLPFKKAIELNHSIIDEPCEATSAGEFPEYAVEGEKCTDGHLKRRWGRGIRSIVCPVCKGTGIKPKTNYDIKWIKFWFDKDGNYVNTTITDGKVREQSESVMYPKYDVLKRITRSDHWSTITTGTLVRITIDGKTVIGTFFREERDGNIYIIQNRADGSTPNYTQRSEWQQYGKYSWNITSGEYIGVPEILKPNTEEKVNPYNWNALYDVSRGRITDVSDVEKRISNAHFAIILDFLELKKSSFKTRSEIKSSREESVKGALSFMTNDEIKNKNIQRYIEELSKRIDIPKDLKDFQKVVVRYMGGNKIGYYILRGRNFSDFSSFIDKIYTFMTEEDSEWYYESAVNDLKSKYKQNNRFNIEVDNDIRETYKTLSEERKVVLKKVEELNYTILNRINSMKIENLNDIEILWEKMSSIRNIWRNSPRFKYMRNNLYYGIENLSDGYRLNRYISDINDEDIEKVLNDVNRFIEIIKNF
jgi:hypothetical protein